MALLNIWKFLFLLGLSIQLSNGFTRRRNDNDNNNSGSGSTDFDLIIFSQSWPKAECQAWKQKSPSNECRLPKNTEWTIHGMWPSELHEMGPSSCTNTKFDPSALDSIREELETKWMDVHAGSNPESFWNHEWSKHGTCSLNLESTNTEKKYFQKALELHDRYNIRSVLEEANIVTGEKYPVKSILDAINQSWGVNAQVTCGQNTETGESFLHEIKICFDKSFQLVNCDGIVGFPSTCSRSQDVTYL